MVVIKRAARAFGCLRARRRAAVRFPVALAARRQTAARRTQPGPGPGRFSTRIQRIYTVFFTAKPSTVLRACGHFERFAKLYFKRFARG